MGVLSSGSRAVPFMMRYAGAMPQPARESDRVRDKWDWRHPDPDLDPEAELRRRGAIVTFVIDAGDPETLDGPLELCRPVVLRIVLGENVVPVAVARRRPAIGGLHSDKLARSTPGRNGHASLG